MSASEAVVRAVRESVLHHNSLLERFNEPGTCSCGAKYFGPWLGHFSEAVAAAAEAAALEAAAEAASYDHRTALFSGGVPTAPGSWGRVAVWLRKRAGEVRDDG